MLKNIRLPKGRLNGKADYPKIEDSFSLRDYVKKGVEEFAVPSTPYVLPVADNIDLGGVKINSTNQDGLYIDPTGTIMKAPSDIILYRENVYQPGINTTTDDFNTTTQWQILALGAVDNTPVKNRMNVLRTAAGQEFFECITVYDFPTTTSATINVQLRDGGGDALTVQTLPIGIKYAEFIWNFTIVPTGSSTSGSVTTYFYGCHTHLTVKTNLSITQSYNYIYQNLAGISNATLNNLNFIQILKTSSNQTFRNLFNQTSIKRNNVMYQYQ